jgi:hypothetical protein
VIESLLFLILTALFLFQAGLASPEKSASFDEQYHLTAGYSYLRTGDFRLATTHPPLAGMVAALPLLPRQDIVLPLDDPLWAAGNRFDFSDLFLWRVNADPQGMLVQARWGITALGILLLVAIFFWARQMIGVWAGWLALTLAVLDPNLVANARVVTTDFPLTVMLVVAAWRLWCWLEGRHWYDLLLAGLFGGLAMAAKYNGLLFWPVALLAALLYRPAVPIAGDRWWRRGVAVVAMGIVGWLVLWAVYGFDFGVPVLLPLALPLPALPVPAPFYWDHLAGTLGGLLAETTVKPDFLLGQVSTGGWWYYFPVALAVKTPLPLIILFVAGLAALARKQAWRRQSIAWLPPLAFLLMGLTGILTIGYRHMLPAIPFAILLAANAVDWLDIFARRWIPAAAGGVLLAWLALGTLTIFPHQEAYFNPLAGDWRNWSNVLVDSNLDWGQDLPALRKEMEARGIDSINLGYFGKGVPETYGVRYRPLPGYQRFMEGREVNAYNPYTPAPGWYAISATALRLGTFQLDTTDLFAYFRPLVPDGRAGYSIYLYNLPARPDETVVRPVVVDTPVFRLAPEELGIAPGVRAQPKWLPTGSTTVYPQGEGFAPPADGTYHAIDADFGGVFTLLGYAVGVQTVAPGQPLAVTLYWQVGATPMPQPAPTRGAPVSAFVHVVDGDPANRVAQADGWEIALTGLEPGDVIAQQLTVDFGADVAPGSYDLLAGLYSPQDWARLAVATAAGPIDAVKLGEIRVE